MKPTCSACQSESGYHGDDDSPSPPERLVLVDNFINIHEE